MSSRRPKWQLVAALLVLLGIAVATAAVVVRKTEVHEWARYPQPEGDLQLVVYRRPPWFAMPGSASDAPGVIRLEDGAGAVLRKTEVPAVSLVSEPEWSPGHVEMKLLLSWDLEPP